MEEEKYSLFFDYLSKGEYPSNFTKAEKRDLRKEASPFTIKKNRLYHRTEREEKIGQKRKRVVVGEEEKQRLLDAVHNHDMGGGHFGRNKTQDKITQRYWWKGITKDVKQVCENCVQCQKSNPKNKPEVAELHPVPVSQRLFHRWGIDLIGQLKENEEGNNYIIVAQEYLSKWAEAAPIPDKSAVTVARFVLDLITRYGVMENLLHDQGKEFCNALNKEICSSLKIKRCIASPYHPQTNGLVERFNQTLITQLRKVVNSETFNDWGPKIQPILFSYRSSMHSSTKRTPFEMLYGVQPRLPVELDMPCDDEENDGETEVEHVQQRLHGLETQLKEARKDGLDNIRKAQAKQKAQYDLKHKGARYEIGEKVLFKDTRQTTRKGDKLKIRRTGPYTIEEVLGKGSYRIKLMGSEKIAQATAKDLLRFREPKEKIEGEEEVPAFTEWAEILEDVMEVEEPQAGEDLVNAPTLLPPAKTALCQNAMQLHCTEENVKAIKHAKAEIQDKPALPKNFNPPTAEWQKEQCAKLNLAFVKSCKSSVPQVVKIRGDHNCLFRAFAYFVTGSQSGYQHVRQLICDFMRSGMTPEFWERELEKSVDCYLNDSRMERNRVWGTDREMVAFANLLQVPVFSWSLEGREYCWVRFLPKGAKKDDQFNATIYLDHSSGNHFDAFC